MLSIQKQNKFYNPNETKTPYLVIDKSLITEKYLQIKQISKDLKIFYAVKANSNKEIISHLQKLGSGFEIASEQELDDVIDAGVSPTKIITSNPHKTPDFIKAANQVGIRYFVYDSQMEVDKLSRWAPGCRGYLRIVVDNSKSEWPLSKKFGVEPSKAISLLEYVQTSKIKPHGITFHVGSQCMDAGSWTKAIAQIAKIFKIAENKGISLKMLNIGGGIPIQYTKNTPLISGIKDEITQSFKKYFSNRDIEIMAEPGRALIGDCGNISTKIILKAKRGNETWLYLDIGVFNGLMETMEGIEYKILSEKQISCNMNNEEMVPYTIAGPTCDSVDTIYKDYLLPRDLGLGDMLYFINTGAYTMSYASNFNGFPVPKTHFIEK